MTKSASRPFVDTRLVKYLDRRIQELRPRKSQAQIATEAGFAQANMLAMLKSGASKLPLDRVPGLAAALECDPKFLFLAAIDQLGGQAHEIAFKQIFGTVVSENELIWLGEIRRASDHSDPIPSRNARRILHALLTA